MLLASRRWRKWAGTLPASPGRSLSLTAAEGSRVTGWRSVRRARRTGHVWTTSCASPPWSTSRTWSRTGSTSSGCSLRTSPVSASRARHPGLSRSKTPMVRFPTWSWYTSVLNKLVDSLRLFRRQSLGTNLERLLALTIWWFFLFLLDNCKAPHYLHLREKSRIIKKYSTHVSRRRKIWRQ